MSRASSSGLPPVAGPVVALIPLPPSRCVAPEARQPALRFGRAGGAPDSAVGGGSSAPGCRNAVAAFGSAPAASWAGARLTDAVSPWAPVAAREPARPAVARLLLQQGRGLPPAAVGRRGAAGRERAPGEQRPGVGWPTADHR